MPHLHDRSLDMESAQPVFTPDGLPTDEPIEAAAIAERIRRAGMAGPAVLLLSAFRPLAWIGGQMLWMLQPFAGAPRPGKQGDVTLPGLARLLEEDRGVERILERLDGEKRTGEG